MTTEHLFDNLPQAPTTATSKRRKRQTASIPDHLRCTQCGGERCVWWRGRAFCPVCDARELWPDGATADADENIDPNNLNRK